MRKGKSAGLAGALGLCLLLTGCYIAPDDVNTGGGTNTQNALPFQTLAPTPVITIEPDVIVVETQSIFTTQNTGVPAPAGTGQSLPTATPTPAVGGSWKDWGTVQTGETDNPEGGAGGISEAEKTATATPTVTATGITVITAPPAEKITTAPETPTPTPPSLQAGFKDSEEVRQMQKRLKELGYYSGSADGDFGPATDKAVKAFQKANGLTADGKAGKQTLAKLYAKDAVSYREAHATAKPASGATGRTTEKATAKPTNTPRPTSTPNLTKEYYLQLGSSGSRVRTLQNRLIQLGWLSGKATGTFDEATEAAVRAFQKKTKGLWDDGVAGPDTLRALYSDGAARSQTVVASSGETLEMGSEGDAVRSLQKRLKELGYLSGSIDGSFGVGTQAAVIAFQQASGLTPDGKAGTTTLNRLYADTARKNGSGSISVDVDRTAAGRDTTDIASTGYVTLAAGSSGAEVRRLQERLKTLGYYGGNTDGNFGESTEAAVMAFQLRNNLTVDGKAGPATQRILYGSSGAISYAALRKGDTGNAVRNLQYTLYELGYYDGNIDGDYGDTTADAVRAFQIQNKLKPVDGVAGSATLARMYSADAIPATAASVDYETVRPGDRGDVVVQVQDCLVQMGYLETVTGVYDAETEAAVKAFQRDNGLTADGVAGAKTLVILFGY